MNNSTVIDEACVPDMQMSELIRAIVENTLDLVIVIDRAGQILYINRTVLGLKHQDVIGTTVFEYVPAEFHDRYREAINRGFDATLPDELRLTSVSNSRWQIRTVPLEGQDGRVDRLLVVATDQTAVATADELLRHSESQLNAIFASAPLAMCVTDVNGQLVRCNRKFEELFGYSSDELPGLSMADITVSEDNTVAWDAFRSLASDDNSGANYTVRIERKDGSRDWAEASASGIYDDQGKLEFVVATIAPLSVSEQFKRQLAEQSARLREAQAIAQVGSFHWDISTNALTWSDEHHRIFGVSPEEFRGRFEAYLSQIHPAHAESVRALINQALTDGDRFSHDYRIVRPDGEVRWVLSRSRVLRGSNGEPVAMEGTCQDITERKHAELLLAGEQRVLESILSKASLDEVLGVLALTVEEQADDAICSVQLFDLRSGQLTGISAPSLPDAYKRRVEGITVGPTAGSCGASVFNRVTTIIEDIANHPNWEGYRDLALPYNLKSCWSTPIISATGEVLGVLAVYHRTCKSPSAYERSVVDRAVFLAGIAIERRTNEQALQESRDRYTRATAAAKVGVWEWNLETNDGYLDPNIKALAGYNAQEIECSQEAWFNLIHPDDRQRVIDLVMEHLASSNDRFEFEHRVHHRDGHLVWVLARGTTDRDAQGRARRLVGTDSDITDRKRVEEKSKRISEFYEAIIHNAAEGICVCHPVADHPLLHFTVWNDQMTRITGYSMEEMNRLGWFECAYPDPDERPQAIERLEFAWRGDHLRSEPWVITRKDGVKRILAISTSHVIAEEGAEAMAAMMHDITDRVLAERAVRESETRFAQFVEAVPQIIWMVSTDNKRNFFVNSAYESITGLKASELSHDPLRWLEIVHPADRARVATHLASTDEQINVEEFRIIRPDGRERWLQNRVIPILDEQGMVYMRVGLSEDITERKHAEENLAHQQVQLAKVSRFNVLGEMVAGITHEITQPLTAIANFAGACAAILETETTDKRDLRDYILEIRNQSTRAGQIVHSLRSLGRRAEATHDRCVLNELLESAVVLLNADLRQAQVEVQMQLEENNATIWADRIQIQQVIVNLVRNSCDALQMLPIHGRKIILRTWLYSSWVVIECEDNGIGLSEDCKNQLFNAFFSTKPDGMGMGLSICRTIVEAHRGRISARNNATRGATISVTLPVHLD